MAIFGFKKRKDEKLEQGARAAKGAGRNPGGVKARAKAAETVAPVKASKSAKTVAPAVHPGSESNIASVILRPRVTEKSGILSQGGVYTFEIARNANKAAIIKAVRALYKVTPAKVAVINTPVRNVFVKGRKGTVAGIRKAIVTVKKGEKIDFV